MCRNGSFFLSFVKSCFSTFSDVNMYIRFHCKFLVSFLNPVLYKPFGSHLRLAEIIDHAINVGVNQSFVPISVYVSLVVKKVYSCEYANFNTSCIIPSLSTMWFSSFIVDSICSWSIPSNQTWDATSIDTIPTHIIDKAWQFHSCIMKHQ